ncbi:hypothetical protein ACLOJK_028358 [Asimina triloba]
MGLKKKLTKGASNYKNQKGTERVQEEAAFARGKLDISSRTVFRGKYIDANFFDGERKDLKSKDGYGLVQPPLRTGVKMVITATLIDDLLSIGQEYRVTSRGIDGVDHEKFRDVTGQEDVIIPTWHSQLFDA